ncbi:HlyD family secretion protein, partial [Fundidesulfovibrio putealis]|uniref:HlyD family secretion protein n=1 Tax=Fundidesulfovibrio putealis TaxID=270496 RepID=UPI000417E539
MADMTLDNTDKPVDPPSAAAPRRRGRKRGALAALIALSALIYGGFVWWESRAFETTDDAFIAGHVTAVSAQVAGRVLEVRVGDNQKVHAGDLLVRLDPATFQAKLDQAQADLNESEQKLQESRSAHAAALAAVEQAGADAASAQAQASNAATDLSRYNQLVHSGAVSQQARDNADTLSRTTAASQQASRKRVAAAEAQAALAATQIQTAQAGVEKFKAALEQARLNLTYATVTAQVDGLVTKKSVEPGDYVQVGQPLLSLVQDELWVVANFKETQLKGMRPGQHVDITVDAYPEHEFKGRLESIQAGTGAAFALLPPQNASGNYVKVVQRVPVKIVFESRPADAGLHLAPGMSVVPRVRVR